MDKKAYEFIASQTGETILEWKKCKWCSENFPIYSGDKEMLDKLSPVILGEKFQLPSPILCPYCRQRKRSLFRNERNIYKRKCDLCNKTTISMYPEDLAEKVYCNKCWQGDLWDPTSFGLDTEDNQKIFEQFGKLFKTVPKVALLQYNNENSDYTNDSTNNKNCYLLFGADYNENCAYSSLGDSKNSIDCLEANQCENCYEDLDCKRSYGLFFSSSCQNCNNSKFLFDCRNCSDCFMCFNLSDKSYCIKNIEYTKEEYFKEIKKYDLSLYENMISLKKEFDEFCKPKISKNLEIMNCENSIGNFVSNSKDCIFCFNTSDGNNCRYVFYGSQKFQDCMDTAMTSINAANCFDCQTCLYNCSSLISCSFCNNCNSLYYCDSCMNCENCFLCIGLKNKKYYILNKPYSESEYFKTISKLIKNLMIEDNWGRFFPSDLTCFPYNDSDTLWFYPIKNKIIFDKKELISKEVINESGKGDLYLSLGNSYVKEGYLDLGGQEKIKVKWRTKEKEINVPEGLELIKSENVPHIKNVKNDILNKAIICEISQRPFRIVKLELDFYKKHNLPIPRKHPDIRFFERLHKKPERKLCLINCSKCDKEILSNYSSDSDSQVYCQECYNKEFY
ncbi:MAG: hypothetical protein PHO80_01330 [Candidatus Gracilibacteria bacterium]|nr:hypothetical protein [Candidatus Gracilibacteria bacterium]